MTVWQKISGFATAVQDAGGGLLGELGGLLGIDRDGAEPQHDIAFTIAVIALAAKMAIADGMVSAKEVAAFGEVFHYSDDEARNVERVFNLAKQDVAGYETYADQIAQLLKDNRRLLQHVLEGLLYVAAADGGIHPKEDEFLRAVSRRFGFSESEYRFFRARFVEDGAAANPYDVLRLSPAATNDEIKAQYRQLVRNNHPDRLIATGVPAEFIDLATRKLAAINSAYETIAKERGL
jgi:DnaJ like chaperone protein